MDTQEQTCLKETRLCVQNLLTILDLVVNTIGEHQLDHFMTPMFLT